MNCTIERLNIEDPEVVDRIRTFLAQHEIDALFLIGNLNSRMPHQHLYLAHQQGTWLGMAGYYATPRSLVPYAPPGLHSVVPDLTAAVIAQHPEVEWLVGPMEMAAWGLRAMEAAQYRVVNDPVQVFMELPGLPAPQAHEARVRLIQSTDEEPVIRLLRWLRAGKDDGRPISAQERSEFALNHLRVVLEIDGQVVATAATNGLAIRVAQILGVATDPAHRGRGYAGAAVAWLVRHLAAQGGRHTVLFTRHDNTPAIRCYQKLGFEITGEYLLAKLARG